MPCSPGCSGQCNLMMSTVNPFPGAQTQGSAEEGKQKHNIYLISSFFFFHSVCQVRLSLNIGSFFSEVALCVFEMTFSIQNQCRQSLFFSTPRRHFAKKKKSAAFFSPKCYNNMILLQPIHCGTSENIYL